MPYETFNPDMADFYEETSRFYRFLISVIILNYRYLTNPFYSYRVFLNDEIFLAQEAIKRKSNKLYMRGVLKDAK